MILYSPVSFDTTESHKSGHMPRKQRTVRDQARRGEVPDFVRICLHAVSHDQVFADSPRPGFYRQIKPRPVDWNLLLEMIREPRDSETSAVPPNKEKGALIETMLNNVMSRHNQLLDDESLHPPCFAQTARWLWETGRSKDLYRCKVCGAWNLAIDDRRVQCLRRECDKEHHREEVARARKPTRAK